MPITVLDAEDAKLNKTNKVLYLTELPSAEDMYSTNKCICNNVLGRNQCFEKIKTSGGSKE